MFTYKDAIKIIKEKSIDIDNKHLIGKEGYDEFWK